MASETSVTVLIAVIMVITGATNTLIAKWTDKLESAGSRFEHPFFQANCMFVGEFFCLVIFILLYLYKGENAGHLTKFNPFLFALPTICDISGTCLQYTGLNLTTASSYQMLGGSVVLFAGLLSVIYLKMHFAGYKWLGMILVSAGLAVIGLCDMYYNGNTEHGSDVIIGDLLIVIAQILHAVQAVLEQQILHKYDVAPLLAVGLEGAFGFIILSAMMVPMYFITVPKTFSHNPHQRLEDMFFALKQISEEPWIAVGLLGLIISIGFFNFASISTTKRMNATTRIILESSRTLIIWMASIPLFGDKFIPLQVLGFVLLVLGVFLYNDVLFGPKIRRSILPYFDGTRLAICCNGFWRGRERHEEDEDLLFNGEQ
ncbi:unnamed protein product [Bursaphelenchus xylophilus]|uniref:(pine wood nematode) hypothetical protein n=1 Tax=Bursaphelenchus xylophilus TaxID=6326 RepID=A0A1I7RJI3_BURXY|nr:unnamed protein product [Bursaphelenchus xylophilus]CAG9128900.1 unnamed protein product [Bursaphelenchus xylophilus]